MTSLRDEIAQSAAQLIAQEGLSYEQAKRKAVARVTGGRMTAAAARRCLPDNEAIESALREHLALFEGDEHEERLQEMRQSALRLAELLADFEPWVGGAVISGTATDFTELHLVIRGAEAKEVAIFLINQGIRCEPFVWSHAPGRSEEEGLWLDWESWGARLRFGHDPQLLKKSRAISAQQLRELLPLPSTAP